MSEVGESGGLRGLFSRITQRRVPQSHQPKNHEPAQDALAQQKLEQTRRAIVEATRIEMPDSSEVIDDIEPEVEAAQLAEQIQAWQVTGNFFKGVSINGKVLEIIPSRGVVPYGDTQEIAYSGGNQYKEPFLTPISYTNNALFHSDKFNSNGQLVREGIQTKHFLSAVNTPDGKALISFAFKHKTPDNRRGHFAMFNFKTDRQHASKLLALVRKNGDAAETFLQNAAKGFEADPETDKPGIQRVKSDEIVILNLGNFNPDLFNRYAYSPSGQVNLDYQASPPIMRAIEQNQNNEIERVSYTRPYGVVDREEIP